MKYVFKIIFIAILAFFPCSFPAYADTLYLKNGRNAEGIIIRDDAGYVELRVCSAGSVKFRMSEISRIERASAWENSLMQQEWEKKKEKTDQDIKRLRLEEERKPREIEFSKGGQVISLNATINGKIEARLVLDTGATVVMLSRKIAGELGIDLEKVKPDMKIQVADGRQVNAKHVLLESIKVQGTKEVNVDAAVLMEEVSGIDADGLLGMSFLKRFNFKVNYAEQKLILEKL